MTHTETQAMCERLDEAEKFLRKVSENVPAVEWGRTEIQSDEAHLSDLADTLRFTREHFPEMPEKTSIDGLYLAGTAVVLAHTGNSPNSPKHAQMLAGLLANVERLADEAAASRTLLTRQQEGLNTFDALQAESGAIISAQYLEIDALKETATRQQEEIERLRSAIEPFSDFARWTIDENGWSGSAQREQIHTWFGPSDFRAALQAKPDEGVNETFTLSDEVKPACDSEDPTEMCLHCHCWKFTRATCT